VNTTGNYVASLIAGTGISVVDNSGETATPTISIGQAVSNSSSVTFAHVSAPITGNVTGNVTGSSGSTTGNSATATTLETARTISLTGDVSGSVSFNGSANASITATIQPNSVSLGTDTSGDYVGSLVQGTGVSITNNSGEGATPAIAIGQDVATSASVQFAKVTAPLEGNATTATALQTSRAISLSGDISGSVSFNGASDVSITANIQPNSVALGTDTTGNYMSDLTQGTGVTITHTPGEGSNATIAIGQAVGTSASVTFAHVSASVTGNVTGNAATATTLQNSRTISLTGDVSGSVSFNGSADASISATIQPNSVALGTDTTGNYVNDLTAGTGVTVTHTPGEGSSPTVAIGQAVGTSSSVQFAAVTAPLIGNAATATILQTARTIAGQSFDGSANISIAPTDLTGVTSSATELNILDGATLSTTELNYVDGVTSAIQTQLDNKASSTSSPVITLGGDLSGSATFTNLGNTTLTATIQPNSVALGTDTTGNYVNDLTAGTGVTVTHTPGEGSSPTVAIGQAVGTSASVTFSNITATGTVTLAADPASALQAATKQYVDNVTAGINFHESVHAASVTNLATIYDNGTAGVGATLTANTNRAFSTLDGESVTVGQRILIKNQTDAKQNGIYTLTTVGSGSAPWVITRATDADNNPTGELKTGDFCFVMAGTVNAGYGYINNSTANPIVIGTDNITYTAFNAAQTITAGTGLDLTFNVMSLDATLDNLSNVIASSPSDGNFLKYVSASSAWIPAAIPTINALDDIGNVSASAPSNGEVLQWNGTAWVPSLVVGPNGLGYKVSGTVDTPIGQEAYGTVKFYADTTLYAYQVGDFVKGSLVYDLGGETISATGTSDSVIDADTFSFGYITFTTSPDDLTVYVGQYITASTPDDPYWVLRGQVSSIGSGTITAGMGVQVSPSTTGVTSEDWTVQRDIYTNPLPVDGINSNIYFKGLITEIVSGNYYSIYPSNYLNAFEGQDAILALAGADGSDGSDGSDGAAGAPGSDGSDGSDGADGNDGNDGLGYPALQTPATQYYDTDTTFGSTGFTIDITGTAYIVGNRVRLVWNTSPDTYYEGKITAFDLISTTLTVDVDLAVGATGAKDVFNLALTGEPGPLETVGFSFSSNTANSASVAVTSVTVDPYGRVTAVSAGNYQFADSSNAGVVRIDGNYFLMDAGTLSIKTGAIYNGNVNASAGIALSKLASGTAGNILVYNASGVLTSVSESGDVTVNASGVTAIKSSVALSGAPTAATASAGTNTTQIATTAFTTTAVRNSLIRFYMEVM
jgi:hypothetical protein